MNNSKFIDIVLPSKNEDNVFPTLRLKKYDCNDLNKNVSFVEGENPIRFQPPPNIALNTNDDLQILTLLGYAGVRYLTPESPAAKQGVDLFRAGRNFAIESAPEWIGFDWDYTANLYKIYAPVIPLLLVKFMPTTPMWVRKLTIRLLEAPKPGIHEIIMGMAVGYAMRQGLRSFTEWNYYRPQVRVVTQTWANRLAELASQAFHIIPIMMGRFPGEKIIEEDVRKSDAFITLEDFLSQIKKILKSFQDCGYKFHLLSTREQDEVMEILQAGQAYKLKPLSSFATKGWLPPTLIFDDSPASNQRFLREGVHVVCTLNPIVPGKDIKDIQAASFTGRKSAARHIMKMAGHTEGPAMINVLKRLSMGEKDIIMSPSELSTTPEGTIIPIHHANGSLDEVIEKFRGPQDEIDRLIRVIIRENGSLSKIEHSYNLTAVLRNANREKQGQK